MQHFIRANGVPFPESAVIKSISIDDRLGVLSDSASISLPYDSAIAFPSVNATLDISLGLSGEDEFLNSVGTFIVNEISLAGTPLIMTIRSSGIDRELVQESWNTNRSRQWQAGTELGVILNRIATDHSLELITLASIYDIVMPYTFQKAESDASFLYRILSDRDLSAKFGNNKMGVIKLDSEQTASGQTLEPLEISYTDVAGTFQYKETTPETFGSVIAKYQDHNMGGVQTVSEGSGEPRQILDDIYADADTARLAAESNLNASRRKNKTLTFSMLPIPEGVVTGQRVIPTDFPFNITGEFIISNVTHNYSNNYTLSVTAGLKVS